MDRRYSIGFNPRDEFYASIYTYGKAYVKKKSTMKYEGRLYTLKEFRKYLDSRYGEDVIEEQLEWFNITED
tara:strand:- start:1980 stop:2192 length:213 start_codon:yes stop_codon:yes gene_type:complete